MKLEIAEDQKYCTNMESYVLGGIFVCRKHNKFKRKLTTNKNRNQNP